MGKRELGDATAIPSPHLLSLRGWWADRRILPRRQGARSFPRFTNQTQVFSCAGKLSPRPVTKMTPATAARRKRIDWMVANRAIWYDVDEGARNFHICAQGMKDAGLYAARASVSRISTFRLSVAATKIINAYEELKSL